MNEPKPSQLPFWQECLRLLYWVFFKPLTLRKYVAGLEPDLPNNNSLGQARHLLKSNQSIRRLLGITLFDALVLPWLLTPFIIAMLTWVVRIPINWSNTLLGMLGGALIGIGAGVMIGVVVILIGDAVLGIVFGIAGSVANSVAFCLGGGVALGFWPGVDRGVVMGAVIGGAVGIALSAAYGVAIGAIFSLRLSMIIGVTISVLFGSSYGLGGGLVAGVEVGLLAGLWFGVGLIFFYFRFFFCLMELFWIFLLRSFVRYRPSQSIRLMTLLPPRYDEVIWLPLFGLAGLLRQAARVDQRAALDEISRLSDSLAQRGQARHALADITADVLAGYTTVEQLSAFPRQVNWLPDDLKQVRPDLAEILPGLFTIGRELSLALQSGNPLSQRLALREAMDQLDALRKKLNYLSREGKERWSPVLAQWHTVMQSGLEQAAHFSPSDRGVENPYQAGTPLPLSRRDLFKGRQELAEELANALRERGRPALILHGPRRMGKTSFLLQLPALLPGRTVPAFVSLQDPAVTNSDSALAYAIAHAITRDAQPARLILTAPVRDRFEHNPFESLEGWLIRARKELQDFNLLLTFDEFEKAGEAIAAGKLTRDVLNMLRTLIEHQPRMALLFAGVQTLDEMGPDWSSYFINARTLAMSYLKPAEAEELIRNPDPNVRFDLIYDDQVVEHILAQTLGHPFLVQLVCSCLVICANRSATYYADESLLAEAEELAFEHGANYFNNVWLEMAGDDGQPLLRQIASASQPLKFDALDIPSRRALTRMTRLKVLRKAGDAYSVEVPLIARWINEYAED